MNEAIHRYLLVHPDNRGNVRETYRASWYPEMPPIVQLVRSESKPDTLRGMHFHKVQWDVWHFASGSATVRLDDELLAMDAGSTLIIPPGIAHGFYTREGCVLIYGLTREYDGRDEYGWFPLDGLAGWPSRPGWLNMSERDLEAPPR